MVQVRSEPSFLPLTATLLTPLSVLCSDCFHRAFASRFHKAIECARIVSAEGIDVLEGRKPERRRKDPSPPKPPGKLVLAFSGGASSRYAIPPSHLSFVH